MTLREKINKHTIFWDCYNDEPVKYNHTGKVLKIVDKFAVEFLEWCSNNYYRIGNTSIWLQSLDLDAEKFTSKELLEIFKKEKGL